MEIIKATILKSDYEQLPKEIREKLKIDYVDELDFDYKENKKWLEAKEKSAKAYKELKRIEFDLRHG